MADPLVAYARELEAEDAALAQAIAEVEALHAESRRLHERAAYAHGFRAGLASGRATAAAAIEQVRLELESRRAAVGEAEEELERAERSGKEEPLLAARRAVVRTRDAAATGERKLERVEEAAEALEREAAAIERDLPGLEEEGRGLAVRLSKVPRAVVGSPAAGLAATIEWTARVEAALFVARSGLEGERERVVRQANELGASAFGEPLVATSVSLVRERLERRPD